MRIVKKRRRLDKAKIKYVASWTSRLLKKISLAVFFPSSHLPLKKKKKKLKIDASVFFSSPSFVKKSFSYQQFFEDIYSFTVVLRACPLEKKTFQHLNLHEKTKTKNDFTVICLRTNRIKQYKRK